ncbi:MAG TPA: hypothetical protein IAC93_07995 [Candidatus Limisoma gallistercoris]|nr:hypothetical protein [Candidatus Limisoma gallistercoris]
MKKQLCKLAIFALLLSTASCSDEQFAGDLTGGETTVTFNAQLPAGLQTRTAGDGLKATTLSYAVYEHGTTTPVITSEDEVTFENRQATLSLHLAKGKTYDFLFWADAYKKDDPKNPYTVNFDTQTLTVNYENALSNDESRDAFFGTANVTVKGAVSQDITLKRPFAQLNIGTNDMAEAETAGLKTDALQSSVKVSGIFSSMNLMTGIPDPSTSREVTFGLNDIPDESFMVDGKTFDYLALNYLLVSDQKGLVNCEFTYTDGATTDTRTIDNVPVQRNYRTNIFGSLLTGSVDFDITIEPDFNTPDYGVAAPWDGKTVTEPKQTDTDILISSPAEWIWLKTHSSNGKNIKLTANLDFGGFEVKGIAAPAVFDGQGYIMSNMVLLPGGSYYSNGLFQGDATLRDVTVKNVTFENITAECSNPEHGYVGVVFGDLQGGNLTLENVHVKDADLCGVQSVGGLVGFVATGKTVSINNCSVEGGYIHNYPVADESGFVAGLVGRPVGTVHVTASEVKDTQIRGYYASRRGETSIAAVVGGQETVDGVTLTNVTVKKTLIDAVASTTKELIAALAENKKDIVLKAGEYELGGADFGASKVNIVGDDREKSVVKVSKSIYAPGKTINLKNLTYSVPAGLTYNEFDFAFIHHAAEFNMEGCVIADGRLRIDVSKSLIDNCQFNVSTSNGFDGYALFYYGNKNSEVTVNNCKFNTAGKAIVVYSEGACIYNLDVNNCVFRSSDASTDKAAIQMHTEWGISGTLDITNSTATGFAAVNNGLWNELNNNTKEPTNKFKVTVDGVVQ